MLRGRRAKRAARSEVFDLLRNQALELDPSTVALAPTDELPDVFGVVVDMARPDGVATLVAIADQTTSLYTSVGGGVIGGGDYAAVADANARLLRVVQSCVDEIPRRDDLDLPRSGDTRITVLSYRGRVAIEARDAELGAGRHPLSPLFFAAHDVITALRMIEQGEGIAPDDPTPDPAGVTPLMVAAHTGNLLGVQEIIAEGSNLDARDDEGYTALMYAANIGHDDIVERLIAAGADVNADDRQRSTPLMFAAQHGHLALVRRLLAAGADPNRRGNHGRTALGFARQNGHRDTEAALRAAGATD